MKITNFLKFLKKPSYNNGFNFAWEVDYAEIWDVFSFQVGFSFVLAFLAGFFSFLLKVEPNSMIGIEYGVPAYVVIWLR